MVGSHRATVTATSPRRHPATCVDTWNSFDVQKAAISAK